MARIIVSDNFDDNVIDPVLWRQGGVVSETGGRARVGCTTDFSSYTSDSIYFLKGSSVHVRLFPPAAGGASSAWASLVINTPTGGTDLIMEFNPVNGMLTMASRVDFFDGSAVTLPYDSVAHAWLRIRETAGTTYWETSPDGAHLDDAQEFHQPALGG